MRKVLLIGMGAGNPDYLTVQAIDALNQVQVFFVPDKGAEKDDLRRLRHDICDRFIAHRDFRVVAFEVQRRRSDLDGYPETVAEWHGRVGDQYRNLLKQELAEGEVGGFLVWGDPSLYDSTLRIIEAIHLAGDLALDWDVIPGISSVQALAARHKIPLNRIGQPVHITTGRRLADGLPGDTVVMLDGEQAMTRLQNNDLDIYWGAYLGTPDEVLIAGRLSEVMDDILRIRAEARAAKGWIMDTYLLRKRE